MICCPIKTQGPTEEKEIKKYDLPRSVMPANCGCHYDNNVILMVPKPTIIIAIKLWLRLCTIYVHHKR